MQPWHNALGILKTLNAAGFEAYLVGGAVRDRLLNLPLEDIDITTSATPNEVASLFPTAIETNKALGTMMVFSGEFSYEVTTFRQEGTYLKHRRPQTVLFTRDLMHDLRRRDFTVNAMLIDEHDQLKDPLNGQKDLHLKQLRAIGEAHERFEEDALRLLRAFRFIGKLGFTLEPNTASAISDKAPLIQAIAIERVQDEWFKLLQTPHAKEALKAMLTTRFADHLYHLKPVIETLSQLAFIPPLNEALALTHCEAKWDESPWRLSKQRIKSIKRLNDLYHQRLKLGYSPMLLFEATPPTIEALERMCEATHHTSQKDEALKRYHALPLHHKKELKLKGTHLAHNPRLPKDQYQTLLNQALKAVLEGVCPNEIQALKHYVIPGRNEIDHE